MIVHDGLILVNREEGGMDCERWAEVKRTKSEQTVINRPLGNK